MSKPPTLSHRDRLRLRAETMLAENTLRRRFDYGLPVQRSTEAKLMEAAKKLGLKLPPPKETQLAK